MNPRSREPSNGYSNPAPNAAPFLVADKRHCSDEEVDIAAATAAAAAANRKRTCDSHSISYAVNRQDKKENAAPERKQQQQQLASEEPRVKELEAACQERTAVCQERTAVCQERMGGGGGRKERKRWSDKVSSTTHIIVTAPSPDSQTDRMMPADPGPPPAPAPSNNKSEFPDYLTEYTTIKDWEQRRRYKTDFNADYAEYRDLHAVVEKVSRRFAQLEERLKQEQQSSQGYKDIRRQIVRDYKENQRDAQYQRDKRRFQYLHDKLSHIKRLVLEYDQGAGLQVPDRARY